MPLHELERALTRWLRRGVAGEVVKKKTTVECCWQRESRWLSVGRAVHSQAVLAVVVSRPRRHVEVEGDGRGERDASQISLDLVTWLLSSFHASPRRTTANEMARSRSRSPAASPGTSGSKRRRYDDRDDTPDASTSSRATGHHRERDSGRERERDGDRDGDRSRGGREPRERSRERRREKESGRSERDHERDRDGGSYRSGERANERASDGRDRDGHRSRGHESPRDDRRSGGSSRRDDRDGSRQRDREYREGRDSRDSYRSPRPRSRSPPSRNRSYSPAVAPTPPPVLKPAFASTFSSASPAPARPESPALPASPNPAKGDDEKIRLRKEKLEAWKAQKAADAAAAASSKPLVKASTPIRPAPAALSSSPLVLRPESNTDETLLTELPAKPLAFTATSTLPKSSSLPAKPAFSFTSNTSRPSNLKTMAMGNVEDDEGETRMGLVEFGAEAVDMSMEVGAEDEGEEDEEDLDGGAAYARKEPREVVGMDVDTEEVAEEVPMQAVEEEEEVDELDAFMSNVQAEVKNVDKQDKARLGGGKAVDRMSKLVEPENEDGDDDEEPSEDEVDRVGDSASDILAYVPFFRRDCAHTDDVSVTDWLPRRSSSEDENCTRSITLKSSTRTSAKHSTTLLPRSRLLHLRRSRRCVLRWTVSR